MATPGISVCLLAHNSADYIVTAIESVLAQTYVHWELLISDDSSSDGTGELVRTYMTDPRIRYVHHEKNLRQPGNWAYAIANTSAPIVATLHADDIWEPGTLSVYAATLVDLNSVDLMWGRWERCSSGLKLLTHQPPKMKEQSFSGADALRHLLEKNPALPSAMAFRRSLAIRAGIPNRDYGMLCDVDYILRLGKLARKARSISTLLMKYRVHSESISTEYTRNGKLLVELKDFRCGLPTLLEGLPDAPKVLHAYDRRMAEFYFRTAMTLQLAGDARGAEDMLRNTIRINPWLLLRISFLAKYGLFHCGKLGLDILRRFHGANTWVNHEEN